MLDRQLIEVKLEFLEPVGKIASNLLEQELDREIFWLDRLFLAYVENMKQREALGLDTSQAMSDLSERLSERTRLQAARLELTLEQLNELAVRIAESPDDTSLVAPNAALDARRKTLTASISRLARQMNSIGLDASEQQKLLITSTGEVTSDIFKPEVAFGLVEEWLGEARPHVQTSQLMRHMSIAVISNAVFVLGLLVALSQLGAELGPMLAGFGISGFILGFALQDSLSNLAAGASTSCCASDTGRISTAAWPSCSTYSPRKTESSPRSLRAVLFSRLSHRAGPVSNAGYRPARGP